MKNLDLNYVDLAYELDLIINHIEDAENQFNNIINNIEFALSLFWCLLYLNKTSETINSVKNCIALTKKDHEAIQNIKKHIFKMRQMINNIDIQEHAFEIEKESIHLMATIAQNIDKYEKLNSHINNPRYDQEDLPFEITDCRSDIIVDCQLLDAAQQFLSASMLTHFVIMKTKFQSI